MWYTHTCHTRAFWILLTISRPQAFSAGDVLRIHPSITLQTAPPAPPWYSAHDCCRRLKVKEGAASLSSRDTYTCRAARTHLLHAVYRVARLTEPTFLCNLCFSLSLRPQSACTQPVIHRDSSSLRRQLPDCTWRRRVRQRQHNLHRLIINTLRCNKSVHGNNKEIKWYEKTNRSRRCNRWRAHERASRRVKNRSRPVRPITGSLVINRLVLHTLQQ